MKRTEEKTRRKPTKKKDLRDYKCHCPFCAFMEQFTSGRKRHHEFWEHVDRAQIEILEALRSLIEHKIQRVQERTHESADDLTKIEIEERG